MQARKLVGMNLRRLRLAQGLSQEALGLLAGTEPSYVGRIERGQENVTVDTLEFWARALGAEVPALFAPIDPNAPAPKLLQPGRKRAVDSTRKPRS